MWGISRLADAINGGGVHDSKKPWDTTALAGGHSELPASVLRCLIIPNFHTSEENNDWTNPLRGSRVGSAAGTSL